MCFVEPAVNRKELQYHGSYCKSKNCRGSRSRLGAAKLGKDIKDVKYDVIEEAKKGFLGMFSAEAEVKVYADDPETTEKTESTDADVQNEEALEALGEAVDEKTCAEDLPPVQDKVIEFLNTIISDMGVDAEPRLSVSTKDSAKTARPMKRIFASNYRQGTWHAHRPSRRCARFPPISLQYRGRPLPQAFGQA